jgi:hypothetical protein
VFDAPLPTRWRACGWAGTRRTGDVEALAGAHAIATALCRGRANGARRHAESSDWRQQGQAALAVPDMMSSGTRPACLVGTCRSQAADACVAVYSHVRDHRGVLLALPIVLNERQPAPHWTCPASGTPRDHPAPVDTYGYPDFGMALARVLADLGGYVGKSSGGPPGAITIRRDLDLVASVAAALEQLDTESKMR